jgi:hypothetical protein
MRAYREQDFDKMAERIVDRFMQGDKLADAATSEAMGGELNPDQIARMTQAANTMAFLRLMEQQKAQGGHDMTSEFDPIDPRQIIQQIVSQTEPYGGQEMPPGPDATSGAPIAGMPPGGDEGPLPDEMHPAQCVDAPGEGGPSPHDSMCVDKDDDNDGPFPKGEKQKAKDDADKPKKKEPPKEPKKDEAKEAAYRERRLRKFADVLEDQYRQAEWAFEDAFSNLQRQLNRAHGAPTMETFEKDALALHGDNDVGVAMLNMVRIDRGMPALEFDAARTKTAALADRHLVEETEATRLFDQIVKIATEASKLQLGAAHVRSMCS